MTLVFLSTHTVYNYVVSKQTAGRDRRCQYVILMRGNMVAMNIFPLRKNSMQILDKIHPALSFFFFVFLTCLSYQYTWKYEQYNNDVVCICILYICICIVYVYIYIIYKWCIVIVLKQHTYTYTYNIVILFIFPRILITQTS